MSTPNRTLFLGHFGSGKTEIAISYALSLAVNRQQPLLVDLDFITPYYRCRDVTGELAAGDVEVIAPEGELAQSELPSVSARVRQALIAHAGHVVVDVGGDEGARVIGSLAGFLPSGRYQALMVINPHRPGTATPEQICAYARWLEQVARIRLTGMVNNANVGPLTQSHHVLNGLILAEASAERLGIPLLFSAARADVASTLSGHNVLPLHLKMKPPWELRALEID